MLDIRTEFPNRDIEVANADANRFLGDFKTDWRQWRGVLFLDPFATEVSWSTIETIANFNALDMWVLFPTQAIARIMPTNQRPEDIDSRWADRLNHIYGDSSWKMLYQTNPQGHLFEPPGHQRNKGIQGLTNVYKNKLEALFGSRFLRKSRLLMNSQKSVLFEFLFCVGNEKGIGPAKRAANHILDRL